MKSFLHHSDNVLRLLVQHRLKIFRDFLYYGNLTTPPRKFFLPKTGGENSIFIDWCDFPHLFEFFLLSTMLILFDVIHGSQECIIVVDSLLSKLLLSTAQYAGGNYNSYRIRSF